MALIVVENLHFAYNGQLVLRGINLKVELGDVVSILGPNGSGKTTLLRCLYKMLKPKIGCIYVNGKTWLSFQIMRLRRSLEAYHKNISLYFLTE